MIKYKSTGDFSVFGNIVSVDSGDGIGLTPPIVLAEKTIPSGNNVLIIKILLRVIDDVKSQILFSIRHNGMYIHPWYRINGELTDRVPSLDINQNFESGLLEVVAHNISGTSEAGSTVEIFDTVRCQAGWIGELLAYDRSEVW